METSTASAVRAKPGPVRGESRSDGVARRLRERIIAGRLPAGELVAESATAERFRVSRVPVREALFALQREGLVVFSGSGRAYVREFTDADFRELLELRLIIEPGAARHAARNLAAGDEALMRRNLDALEKTRGLLELQELDLELHTLIVGFARLPRLQLFWESLLPQIRAVLAQGYRAGRVCFADVKPVTIAGQRRLVETVGSRDGESAAAEMAKHVVCWSEWFASHPTPV